MPGCPAVFIDEYVYDDEPGSGQLPWGLYDAILAWELCELPLLTPVDKGLKLSVPVTPEKNISGSTLQWSGVDIRRVRKRRCDPFRDI